MVAHAFHPSRDRWISVSSRPAWSTEQVAGQPRLHGETLLGEREREREREREQRQRDRERDRERHRQTDKQTDRQRQRELKGKGLVVQGL